MENGERKMKNLADIIHFPLSVFHSFFDRRFLNQHNGNLVADGIDERALGVITFQTRLPGVDRQRRFALRAAKDLK